MKKWRQLVAAAAIVLGMGAVMAPTAGAVNVFQQCSNNPDSQVCAAANNDNASSLIKNVINTLLIVLGMIAVIMIVIGGIRYTTSHGDSSQTKAARETILYSVVGLVVAIMSYAIVNFVVAQFLKP